MNLFFFLMLTNLNLTETGLGFLFPSTLYCDTKLSVIITVYII